METVLLVVHLLVAIFLVSVILMQRSSGGALDGLGGGSGANSILSARGHSGDIIFYHQPFAVAAVQERRT